MAGVLRMELFHIWKGLDLGTKVWYGCGLLIFNLLLQAKQ